MTIKEGFTSKLLNYTEPYSINNTIKTKFFSEHDTNYSIGDTVYIVNGNYDSEKVSLENNIPLGYEVLFIDKTGIVLDIDYQSDVPPYNQEDIKEFTKVYLVDNQDRYSYENVDNNYSFKKLEGDKYSNGNNFILLNKLKSTPLMQDAVQYNSFYKTTKPDGILSITNSNGYLYSTTATASDTVYDQPIGATYNISSTFSYITPFYSNIGNLASVDYDIYTADDSVEISSFIGLSSTKLWRNVLYNTSATYPSFPFQKIRVSNEVSLQGNFNRLSFTASTYSVIENYMLEKTQTSSYIVDKLPSGVFSSTASNISSAMYVSFEKTEPLLTQKLFSTTASTYITASNDLYVRYYSNFVAAFGSESRYCTSLTLGMKSDMTYDGLQHDVVLSIKVYGIKWLSQNGYDNINPTFKMEDNSLNNPVILFNGTKTVVSDNTAKTIDVTFDTSKLDFYNAYAIDYKIKVFGFDITNLTYETYMSGNLFIKYIQLGSNAIETVSTKTLPTAKTISPTKLKETVLYNTPKSYFTIATDSDGAFIYGDTNGYISQATFVFNTAPIASKANIGSGSSNIDFSTVGSVTPTFRIVRGDRFPTKVTLPKDAASTNDLLSAKISHVEDNRLNKIEPANNSLETSNQIVYSTNNGIYFFVNDKESSDNNSLLGIHLNFAKVNPFFGFVSSTFNNVYSTLYIGRVKSPPSYVVPSDPNYVAYFDMSNNSFLSKRWFKYLVHSEQGLFYVYINAEYAKNTTLTFKFSDDNIFFIEQITNTQLSPSGLDISKITTIKYLDTFDTIVFGFSSTSTSCFATFTSDTLPFTNDPTTVGYSITGIEYSSKYGKIVVSYYGKGLRLYTPFENSFETIDASTVILHGYGLPSNNITQLTLASDAYYDYIAVNTPTSAWKLRFDLVSLLPFYTKVDFDNNLIPLNSDIERNSKILIMEDFEYNGIKFLKDKVYKYLTSKKSWVLDIEYNVPLITKANFRKGLFVEGVWNDGLLGHPSKKAVWNDSLQKVNFRSGIVYNTHWLNGQALSKSKDLKTYQYSYLKDGKLNTYSDTLNNGGFGYTNFSEATIENIVLENGVIQNSILGTSSVVNTLENYATSVTVSNYGSTVSITKSKIFDSEIISLSISNSKIFNTKITNTKVSNSVLVDSKIEKSVLESSTIDNNGVIKVIDYDKWFNIKKLVSGKIEVSIIHKFFVSSNDLLKINYGDKINLSNVVSNYKGSVNVFNNKNFYLRKGYLTDGEFSDIIEDLHENNLFPVKIIVGKKTDRQNLYKTYLLGGGTSDLDVFTLKNTDKKYASVDVSFVYGEFDSDVDKSIFDDDGLQYTSVKDIKNSHIHLNSFTNNIINNSVLKNSVYVGERSHKISYIGADNRLDARLIAASYSIYNYVLSLKLDVHNDIITLNSNDIVYLDNIKYNSTTISNYDISGYYKVSSYSTASTTVVVEALTANFTASIVATGSIATISSPSTNNYVYTDSIYNTEINKGFFTKINMQNITFVTKDVLTTAMSTSLASDSENVILSEQNVIGKTVDNKAAKISYYRTIFDNATVSGGNIIRSVVNASNLTKSVVEESYVDSSTLTNSVYKNSNVDIRLPYTGTTSVAALWINSTASVSEVYNAVWLSGTFSGGLIYNTKWISGVFVDGRFGKKEIDTKNSIFYSGVFGNSTVKNSIFDNGVFGYDSDIYGVVNLDKYKKYSKNSDTLSIGSASWLNGTFNNGVLTGSKYQQYTFNNITDEITLSGTYVQTTNTWFNGTFNGGSIVKNVIWQNGTFNGGKFTSIYGDGYATYSWNDGTFNGGVFGSGTASFTTWKTGIFNGGSFIGTIWNDGIFTKGEFVGSGKAQTITRLVRTSATVSIHGALNPSEFVKPYNDMTNYYGLWRNGKVTANVLESNQASDGFLKAAAIENLKITDFKKKPNNSITFKNMLWVRGSFDAANTGKMENSVWLSGQFLNGEMYNSSFNPYVARKNYGTTSSTTYMTYDLSDYTYWNNGKLVKSNFYVSDWNNGIFEGGVNDFTNKIDQTNGNMIGGLFKKGTSNYMNAYNIIWKSGRWRNGNWYGANIALKYGKDDIQAFSYITEEYGDIDVTDLDDDRPKFLRDIIANNFNRFNDLNGNNATQPNVVIGGNGGTFDMPDTTYPTAISGVTLTDASGDVKISISNNRLFVDTSDFVANGSEFEFFTIDIDADNLDVSTKYLVKADITALTNSNIDIMTIELIDYTGTTLVGSVVGQLPYKNSTAYISQYYNTSSSATGVGKVRFTYQIFDSINKSVNGFYIDNVSLKVFKDGKAFAWNCFDSVTPSTPYAYLGVWSGATISTAPFGYTTIFGNSYYVIGSQGETTVSPSTVIDSDAVTVTYAKTSSPYLSGLPNAVYFYNVKTTNQIIFTPDLTPLMMVDDNDSFEFTVGGFTLPTQTTVRFYSETSDGVYTLMKNGSGDAILSNTSTSFDVILNISKFIIQKGGNFTTIKNPKIKIEIENTLSYTGGTVSSYTSLPATSKSSGFSFDYVINKITNDTTYKDATNNKFSETIVYTINNTSNTDYSLSYFNDTNKKLAITNIDDTITDVTEATFSLGTKTSTVKTMIGNGAFLEGIWENGAWNSGARTYTPYDTTNKTIVADKILSVYKKDRNTWNIVIGIPVVNSGNKGILDVLTFMKNSENNTVDINKLVSVGNLAAIDINGNRKVVKDIMTATLVLNRELETNFTSLGDVDYDALFIQTSNNIDYYTLVLEYKETFPIVNIVKDSDRHAIYVSKNIWMNGLFLNGIFEGVWNDGLMKGSPYITVMNNSQWIDGDFDGGRFTSVKKSVINTSYTPVAEIGLIDGTNSVFGANSGYVNSILHTGLVQHMRFNDNLVLNSKNNIPSQTANENKVYSYLSHMDVVYDDYFMSSIFDQGIVNDRLNSFSKTGSFGYLKYKNVPTGQITYDILSSESRFIYEDTTITTNIAFKEKSSYNIYNLKLGTKYKVYDTLFDVDFSKSPNNNPLLDIPNPNVQYNIASYSISLYDKTAINSPSSTPISTTKTKISKAYYETYDDSTVDNFTHSIIGGFNTYITRSRYSMVELKLEKNPATDPAIFATSSTLIYKSEDSSILQISNGYNIFDGKSTASMVYNDLLQYVNDTTINLDEPLVYSYQYNNIGGFRNMLWVQNKNIAGLRYYTMRVYEVDSIPFFNYFTFSNTIGVSWSHYSVEGELGDQTYRRSIYDKTIEPYTAIVPSINYNDSTFSLIGSSTFVTGGVRLNSIVLPRNIGVQNTSTLNIIDQNLIKLNQ